MGPNACPPSRLEGLPHLSATRAPFFGPLKGPFKREIGAKRPYFAASGSSKAIQVQLLSQQRGREAMPETATLGPELLFSPSSSSWAAGLKLKWTLRASNGSFSTRRGFLYLSLIERAWLFQALGGACEHVLKCARALEAEGETLRFQEACESRSPKPVAMQLGHHVRLLNKHKQANRRHDGALRRPYGISCTVWSEVRSPPLDQ